MSKQYQVKFLRVIGISEGVSFLVLLTVAMPLKYYLGFPMAVKVVGWLHGILFMAYILIVLLSIKIMRWNAWSVFIALGASLLPFGTIALDRSWRKREREVETVQT